MMNWVMWPDPHPYLKALRDRLNQWETELDSSFGRDSKEVTENGSDLIKKFSLKSGHNISIKHISEPNTTMILITLDHPSSTETNSNTTTKSTSLVEMEVSGTSKE